VKQSAAVRPEPNHQRKAAIAHGGAIDNAGAVAVMPIPNFDLGRTIFHTLEGKAARYVIQKRIAKDVRWFVDARAGGFGHGARRGTRCRSWARTA